MIKKKSSIKCRTLLDFIDGKAFDVVLDLPAQTYIGKDKEIFMSICREVQAEKEKLHAYRSPVAIRERFLNDVCPETIRENADIRFDFHCLSSFPEIRKEFISLCEHLKIT
jgi:hypothetical protein